MWLSSPSGRVTTRSLSAQLAQAQLPLCRLHPVSFVLFRFRVPAPYVVCASVCVRVWGLYLTMTVSQGAAGGRLLVAWVLVCSLWLPLAAAGVANISNSDPRVDANTGAILDMHDGNTMRINDTFFWSERKGRRKVWKKRTISSFRWERLAD